MRIATLALIALLSGCAAQAAVVGQPGGDTNFDVQALVTVHPLYPTLAQYDRQIAALRDSLHVPEFARKSQAFGNAQRNIQSTLDDAASRTKAIAALPSPDVRALEAGTNVNAPSESRVRNDMQQNYSTQASQVRATAQHDMDRYRAALLSQQNAALANYERSVRMRVQQAYNSRRQELYEKESTLALDLAKADTSERVGIETKLRTLALDGGVRRSLQAQLGAIQARENAIVAQQRRRDEAILAAFLPPLQARADADVARMRADLQNRTAANLAERERVLAAQMSGSMHLNLGPTAAAVPRAGDMQTQIQSLASAQPADPAAFTAARDSLTHHFDGVRTDDDNATRSTWRQIGILRAERDQLYADIIAQITREAQRLARERGLQGAALTAAVRNELEAVAR